MEQNRLSELIRKYADRTASEAEVGELEAWYRTVHAVEAVEWPAEGPGEIDQVRLRMLSRLRHQMHDPIPETSTGTRIVLPRIRTWVRVAAAVILITAAWLVFRQKDDNWIVVNSTNGKTEFITEPMTLPDGSRVWLNASSTLQYAENFTRNRTIKLNGEAYFDVTENKEHPFRVMTGSLSTTVLGTSFDIKSYPDEQQQVITVIRGKVRVDNDKAALDVLTPSRQLQYDIAEATARTVTVDTNLVAGWQQGKFVFQGETLAEITKLLGRRYKVSFSFETPALKNCRMYAHFEQSQSLQQILNAISMVIDLKFSIDDKTHLVTLSGKGC